MVHELSAETLHRLRRKAVAQRESALEQWTRVRADRDQHLIDAEVRDARRSLLEEARLRAGDHAAVLFDAVFLAIADLPTRLEAILGAALAATDATACDLRLLDPHDGTLRVVAYRGLSPPAHRFPRDVASYPLSLGGEVLGVLSLHNRRSHRPSRNATLVAAGAAQAIATAPARRALTAPVTSR
ncbi:hypothetical protein FPZ12_028165 [Amycolatopsis acidicola]|uniref:GAF domain-containing protein n=1 Tax=Amycolatopsis acidicola TaxID=2596893 RepID=A0A5N0UV03_9PSEU|nr:hypothetical protein [Amycolatopsis acidicola]KAA9156203.1 hypothetical protein FPZ12_028165 [Amycolatopsis acidicola]